MPSLRRMTASFNVWKNHKLSTVSFANHMGKQWIHSHYSTHFVSSAKCIW